MNLPQGWRIVTDPATGHAYALRPCESMPGAWVVAWAFYNLRCAEPPAPVGFVGMRP